MSFLALSLAAFTLAACANPGQPKPPSLRLPDKARGVSAARVGYQVILSWTTLAKTTDGDPIREPVTAVICREGAPHPSSGTIPCNPVQRVTVAVGPSHAAENLPAAVRSGPPMLLTYRVELLNSHGRSAGTSDAVFAVGGAPPAPAGPLTIAAQRNAALITWTRTRDAAPMHLTRILIQPADAAPKPARTTGPTKPLGFTSSKIEPATLSLSSGPGLEADPGGMIDRTVHDNSTYTYVAERVRTVELSGHRLEMRGDSSPAATFTFHDVMPPTSPTGLVSIAGGGFDQADSIDLSWDANPEPDILGYNIYRSDTTAPDRSFLRLNSDPVPSSSFRDLHADPGHTYAYRVTAVDQRHNESTPGDTIRETLRK